MLAQYHLHPEGKFGDASYLDSGAATRRHVRPMGPIKHIGKEANRWEEQVLLGANPEVQIEHGSPADELASYRQTVAARAARRSVRTIAERAGVSVGTVSAVARCLGNPSRQTLAAIDRAVGELMTEDGAGILDDVIGAQAALGERLAAASAAVVVGAAAVDLDDPRPAVAVALALGGEVVAGKVAAGGTAGQPDLGDAAVEADEADEVLAGSRATAFEAVADEAAGSPVGVGVGAEAGTTSGHLACPGQAVGQLQPLDDQRSGVPGARP